MLIITLPNPKVYLNSKLNSKYISQRLSKKLTSGKLNIEPNLKSSIKKHSKPLAKKCLRSMAIATVVTIMTSTPASAGLFGEALTSYPHNLIIGIISLGIASGMGSPVLKAFNKPNIAASLDSFASIVATGSVISAIVWLMAKIAQGFTQLGNM